ncbi:Fe2+-dependent dioxygenase [Hyphomonas johnsonii]|uniref:2OG-Fe(II) oxygenase n=1 Tax=Hyphomonas johnsonii MHS-2 TaxID=1280950 RepID=A0A059FSJ5_9PROT|nr:Fe2+-dependent dioxygenase [Hyphomonas johnsonii]KCZ93438.1 2OG-Fe(II) oxygenase [Hyphomonas johnsonii MHS-2]
MLLTISDMLDEKGLLETHALIETLRWRDGAETAGSTAKHVKHNLQADLSSRTGVKLCKQLLVTISAHPVIRAAGQPRRFSEPVVSKTVEGGAYGLHIDNAHMGTGDSRIRTDLSYTLFLSDPQSYAGGELVIERAGETLSVKPDAGSLVLYPSSSLHRVAEVTRGARLAVVGWIESTIPDAGEREMVFDLENLRASLSPQLAPQSAERLILDKVIANLIRKFSAA